MGNIIVNADDYGLSPDISAVILQALKEHAIHSTSVDVCNGITRSEAEKLLASGISIGLHLNLTEGRSMGDGKLDLVYSNGRFKPGSQGLSSPAGLKPIFVELKHQVQRFQFLFGRKPTHLDSHQHFTYLHPSAFEAMLKLAKAEEIPIRSPKPFIHGDGLRNFCDRVRFRYGINLAFKAEERAAVLEEIFCRYRPELRSQDLYLDFDPKMLRNLHSVVTSSEMIIHPHLPNKGEFGRCL